MGNKTSFNPKVIWLYKLGVVRDKKMETQTGSFVVVFLNVY